MVAVIAFVFVFMAHFWKIDQPLIHVWDEARNITNAYEMTKNGNLIVLKINGETELWNTKPPLLISLQAASIKIVGLSEVSARFPSSMMGAFTCLLIFWFTHFVTKNKWAALCSVIVLCTSIGWIGGHGTRFAEFDSTLSFFTTAYVLLFYLYVITNDKRQNKYLLLFFICLTLAVLTKSVAGLLFTPALFLYLTATGKLINTLKNPFLYIGILIFIIFVGGYYILREVTESGYLQAVFENELGGRFNKAIEEHKAPFEYYWYNLRIEKFGVWYWGLITLCTTAIFTKINNFRSIQLYLLLCVAQFLLVISYSETKLYWYDLPMYPLMAISIAVILFWIAKQGAKLLSGKMQLKRILLPLLTTVFSIQPTYEAYNHIKRCTEDFEKSDEYAISHFLKHNETIRKESCIYLVSGYSIHHKFYSKILIDKGYPFRECDGCDIESFQIGENVVLSQPELHEKLLKKFEVTTLEQFYNVRLLKIIGRK